MTEAEWLSCADPAAMLTYLRGRASDRKLRLFAVACARQYLHLTRDPRVGEAIEAAERFADGLVGDAVRSNARKAAQQAAQVRGIAARPDAPKWERRAASLAYYATARNAMEGAWNMPDLGVEVLVWWAGGYSVADGRAIRAEQGAIQANLLREFFGNSFRAVALDSSWVTSTVLALAWGVYDDRAFDRLPILADALEEAGCDDAEVLEHCRGPGPHVRGCWVIDELLGKG